MNWTQHEKADMWMMHKLTNSNKSESVEKASIEITTEMIEAGAAAIFEADWEFRGDHQEIARAIYSIMESERIKARQLRP